jgi:hypothetical protein
MIATSVVQSGGAVVEPRVPVSPERTLVRANVFFYGRDFAKAKVIREKTDSMLFIA